MEMDDTLIHFFKEIDVPNPFEMENDQGIKRKFSIDWVENLLQGRGIKGFFAPYSTEFLTIELTRDKKIKVSAANKVPTKPFSLSFQNKEQAQTVVNALASFTNQSDKWFQLYQIAEQFRVNPNGNELLCLPYVRELETYEYQIKTVHSVINHFKGRVMLSDEVGLGKTVEAGMAMLEYLMRGLVKRILILVPPSLVSQWENEMKRKFNQDFIRADHPDFKKLGADAWAHFPKVIASIDTAKRKEHRCYFCAGIRFNHY